MMLVANALGNSNLNIGTAGILALLGYAVVFLGLISLMVVVILLGKIFAAVGNHKKVEAPVAAPRKENIVAEF